MENRSLLFVDHAQALGGAERSLLMLLERLGSYGWQPFLACPEGGLADAARNLRVPVHRLGLPRLRRSTRFAADLAHGARDLARLATAVEASAVYANTVRAAIFCALACKWSRHPFIWHMRDFWLSESRPSRLWPDRAAKRLLLDAASGVLANSRAVANQLPPSTKICVVLNGIDTAQFSRKEADGAFFRAHHALPPGALLVGTVGRLRPWKGQDRFLRVAKQVANAHPDSYFVVAGGSPFAEQEAFTAQLHAMAMEPELVDRVLFTGHLDDVRPVLAALDLFVHAGDPEPFGLVNVEAMAMGLPVIAFAHGALPEIVIDGACGLLVTPGDETAMAGAVLTLLEDAALRRRMGKRSHERALSHFSIERTVREVDAALRQFLMKDR